MLTALAAPEVPAAASEDLQLGPIPLRTLSPLRLLFYQPTPEGSETLGRGESLVAFDLSESNVLQIPNNPASEFDAEINLEVSRVHLRFRHGLSERTDLTVELPLYRFHTGFLDTAIRGIEDLVGDLKVQRVFEENVPGGDLFRFQLKRNGELFFERPGPRSGVGDLAIGFKRSLRTQGPGRPALSARAALKLPTGDESILMGSGDVDLALGLATDYEIEHWGFHSNLNVTLPFGDPFEAVGLETPPIVSAHVGMARRVSPTWVFHFQLAGLSEPFELATDRGPTDLPPEPFENFGGSIIEGLLGVSHALGRRSELWLAIAEDFQNTNSAASDVTLLVSFSLRAW